MSSDRPPAAGRCSSGCSTPPRNQTRPRRVRSGGDLDANWRDAAPSFSFSHEQYTGPTRGGAPVIVLVSASSGYLAWHYTGQVWGMMASYAYLAGTRFEKTERLLIRTGLRILLAWQVTWFLYTQLRNPATVRPVYVLISAGT